MTDPETSYERRDELRAIDHDAIQLVLRMMTTALEAQRETSRVVESLRERADKREQRAEERFDELRKEIAALRKDNARQDRLQAHDGAISAEAMSKVEDLAREINKPSDQRSWAAIVMTLITAAGGAVAAYFSAGG